MLNLSSVFVFVPCLNFGLPYQCDWSSFISNPLFLYWIPVSVVVRFGGIGAFYDLPPMYKCFSIPVSQDWSWQVFLQWHSFFPLTPIYPTLMSAFPIHFFEGLTPVNNYVFFFPYVSLFSLQRARVRECPFLTWVKTIAKSFSLESRPLLWRRFHAFHNDYSFIPDRATKGLSQIGFWR